MSDKQKVLDYIDAHQEDLVQYLMELVRRPSVNPGDGKSGEEIQVQGFIADSLRSEGFDEVRELAFDPEKRRPNVVGRRKGAGGGRSLIFNGHCDVVPVTFPERWIFPPFEPGRDGDRLYGRGTSDMKGGIAGAYFAMKALKECQVRLKGDVMLQAVAGEESQQAETIGTSKVVESGYRADFAVCCEPSDTELHIASSALIFLRLIVEGKGVHVSARNQMLFPQPALIPSGNEVAVDAFRKSLPLVDYIHRLEVEWNHRYRDPIMGYGGKPFHDRQGVGVFTINPSAIHGGEYLGTIPSRMEYTYAIWYPDQLVSRDDLIDEVRRGIAAIASTDDWLREHPPVVEAPIIQDWPGFHVDENIEGVKVLRGSAAAVLGSEPVISGFKAVCDAYYLNKLGIPCVVLGPGSIFNSVHGDNEFILVSDLVKTTKVYAAFMMDWCGVAD